MDAPREGMTTFSIAPLAPWFRRLLLILPLLHCALPAPAFEPEDVAVYGDARMRLYAADPQPAAAPAPDSPPLSGDMRLRAVLSLPLTDALAATATAQWVPRLIDRRHAQASDARMGEYAVQWDQCQLGKTELRWENIAFMPVSWTVGRTVSAYDEGLIFSGADDAWLVDGTALKYDTWPLTVQASYAEVTSLAPDTDLREFLFLHASSQNDRALFRRHAFYSGLFRMRNDGEPVLGGLRSTFYEDREWCAALELAGETGQRPGGDHLLAGIADASLARTWRAQDQRVLTLQARCTWAGGDPQPDGPHTFIPIMNCEDWGCVFSPSLRNIRIYALSIRRQSASRWALQASAFHYEQQHPASMSASSGNFNNGGYELPANGTDAELGSECDVQVDCALSERLSLELIGGRFFRGAAYAGVQGSGNASEIRLQLTGTF